MFQRGQTPLHLAAENDHSEVVKLFLRHRPELATLANMEGATCAHIAAAKGSAAVIRELLTFNQGGPLALNNKVRRSRVKGDHRSGNDIILCFIILVSLR